MEKNKTRQEIACLAELGDYITQILNLLDTLPDSGAEVNICDIVTTANTEDLANLLDCLAGIIETDFTEGPYGFLAQIERLVCIIRLLADRVRAITCPDAADCLEILFEVLCVLVEAIAILVGIIIKLIVLESFLGDNDNFFECLVCSLIGEITCLEESVKDLSCLIIALISCDIEECTPCFVQTTANKRPRINVNKNVCFNKNECSCKKH